jgi:pimeloyl-ACP methyl ester carboxylesterase
VQLLQSGATYGSEYWDFGYHPSTYSYVRKANAAGFATLNLDRLGIGTSTHPAAGLITTATEANIAHLLVRKLRDGAFGTSFDRVALVGHSYGSVIALAESGTYRDVDAVVLTGLDHEVAPGFVTTFTASLAPADLADPDRFGDLAPGYLTTRPGTRTGFYYTPNADPAAIAYDEATKQTFTVTEDATFPTVLPDTLGITAPVDVVVGQYDALFCGPVSDCANPLSLTSLERTFYPSAASFAFTVIPDAGHSLNLQRNAPATFAAIDTWLTHTLP